MGPCTLAINLNLEFDYNLKDGMFILQQTVSTFPSGSVSS